MSGFERGEVSELVEGARLEIVCTLKAYREFESLPLRQQESKPVEKSTGFSFWGRQWSGFRRPGKLASGAAGPCPSSQSRIPPQRAFSGEASGTRGKPALTDTGSMYGVFILLIEITLKFCIHRPWSFLTFAKGTTQGGIQRLPVQSKRKDHVFSRNNRPYDVNREASTRKMCIKKSPPGQLPGGLLRTHARCAPNRPTSRRTVRDAWRYLNLPACAPIPRPRKGCN